MHQLVWIIRSYTDLTRAGDHVDLFSSWERGVEWLRAEQVNSRDDGLVVSGEVLDGVLEIRDEDVGTSVTYVLSEISGAEARKVKFRIPDPPVYRRPRLP